MNIITHQKIDQNLCGTPILVESGKCIVEMTTTQNMTADQYGLVHGGFIFGLADYAAMLAVNHPNVVLGGSEVKFLKPVVLNDKVTATAETETTEGKKQIVNVKVTRDDDVVFEGRFTCFVLAEHILS